MSIQTMRRPSNWPECTVKVSANAQEEGLQQFQQYLCKLVAERAQQGYNVLVEGGALISLRL